MARDTIHRIFLILHQGLEATFFHYFCSIRVLFYNNRVSINFYLYMTIFDMHLIFIFGTHNVLFNDETNNSFGVSASSTSTQCFSSISLHLGLKERRRKEESIKNCYSAYTRHSSLILQLTFFIISHVTCVKYTN